MSSNNLHRVLGTLFGVAVTVGNTIGSGILRTPGEIAAAVPNVWLFFGVWLLGGCYALLGAFSVAELGTTIPRSGGQYVFARRVLGEYAGFVVGWSDWISTCGTTAAVSILIAEYAGVLFPQLAGRIVPVAAFIAVGFAVLQWRGIESGSRTQNLTSLLKALAFLALIAACFLFGGRGNPVASQTESRFFLWSGLVAAVQAVIYTYDGWTGAVYFSGEFRDPAREVPRTIFGSLISIIGIYLLVNAAIVYVVGFSNLAGDKLAAGTAASVLFGPHGDTVIRTLTILALLSSINAYHLMATRVVYAMSCDRLVSRRLQTVNAGGTPTAALAVSTVVAVLFILSGTFEKVIAVLAFFFVANYTISFLSVFVLRRGAPDLARPYRAWGYPWTTGLALVGSVAFLVGAALGDTRNSLYALGLLAASWPVFRAFKRFSGDQATDTIDPETRDSLS